MIIIYVFCGIFVVGTYYFSSIQEIDRGGRRRVGEKSHSKKSLPSQNLANALGMLRMYLYTLIPCQVKTKFNISNIWNW